MSRITGRRLHGLRRGLLTALSGAVAVSLVIPSAWADETADLDDELARVRSDLAATASTVAEVEVALADQQSKLEQITIESMVSRENHTDALAELDDRESESEQAQKDATAAADKAEEARRNLARVALQAERSGTSLTQIEAFVTADGFDSVVARSEAYDLLGGRISDAEQDLRAARLISDTMAERADRAVEAASVAADDARDALETYEEAEKLATVAVSESESVYNDLIARMADLRGTSVDLEDQRHRQREAERVRREQEALRARAEREAAESQPQNATPADNPATPAPRPTGEPEADNSPSPGPTETTRPSPGATPRPTPSQTAQPTPAPSPTPTPTSTPKPTPPPTTPPGSSSTNATQGKNAVAWARNQVGKGYLLGAIGPSVFDCSGLTSQAWLHGGGKAIQRTSRAQYQSVKKIPYSEMRPGDLIFWGTSNDWTSVYHVAIYAGNNMMIEAVRPGVPVREVAFGSWGASDMMPFAGRP